MKPVLYGVGFSLYVRKVRLLLEFKGIEYDHIPVLPIDPPEGYRDISPLGKVPALKVGDFSIPDSSVICQYLDKKYPERPLIPNDAEGLAKTLWFDEYSDSKMSQSISAIFFEKFGKPLLLKQEPDANRIADLEKQIPEIFDYLEKVLQGQKFLVGNEITFGDLGVLANLYNHKLCGYKVDPVKWPNVAGYIERALDLPFIKSVTEKEHLEFSL